jgi:hypothetical protein
MVDPARLAIGGVILLAACRAPVLPPAPPRASEWGLRPATSASAPGALPTMTVMCRDVFAARLAEVDAERIHVASPTPACEPVVRELARRPGIMKWRDTKQHEQTMRCPGPCGPRNGVLVTLTHERAGCFHAAVRVATGGSFSTLCWENGTVVTREPLGVW